MLITVLSLIAGYVLYRLLFKKPIEAYYGDSGSDPGREGYANSMGSDSTDAEWFIEEDSRGNRFMISDPLDAPTAASEAERHAMLQEMLAEGYQLTAPLIALRRRIIRDEYFLETTEGVDALNSIAGGTYDAVSGNASQWKTNDFRKLGLEFLTA